MRNKLIFGSTAMKHWFSESRKPKDLDYISPDLGLMEKDVQSYWIPEFQEILDNNKDDTYVDAYYLAQIKYSHFGFDIHWEKTANDVIFFQRKGFKLDEVLYKKLHKGFTNLHGKRWASLKNKDSETFFQDAVERKYNHDDLHETVAVYDKPLYERILKNPETKSVECSKEKFDKLEFNDKLLLVQEEVWVTALERFLVPSNFTYGKNLAYHRSLKKLATSMSSGWFKMFIIANYQYLYKNTDWTFIQKFKEKYE